jgi:hypothetical protein
MPWPLKMLYAYLHLIIVAGFVCLTVAVLTAVSALLGYPLL